MSTSTVPEKKPLLEDEEEAPDASQVQPPAQVAAAPSAPEDTEEVVELGDRILVDGGRLHFTRGRVYYRDADLIRIQPDGTSDRLVDIPLIDGEPDPDLKVDGFIILEKRRLYTFVEQQDFAADQTIETFTGGSAGPQEGPKFKVRSVNKVTDTAVLVDDTGDELTLEFGWVGIPRDAPFVVMRVREALPTPPMSPEEEAVAAAEAEAAKAKPIFQILGTIELPKIPELSEIPIAERVYPDLIQRSDMIQDLLKLKTPAQQKNPKTLVEIRRIVELCILLRNDVIDYGSAGSKPRQKPTSAQTLLDLLESGAPLAKPVLDAVRTLYVDALGVEEKKKVGIRGALLANVVKESMAYLSREFPQGQKPSWIIGWQKYVDDYFSPWISGGAMPRKAIKRDTDFFRAQIPDLETAVLNGFPKLITSGLRGAVIPLDEKHALTIASLDKVVLSYRRALGPRRTRATVSRGIEVVMNAQEAAILNYILFPFDAVRDVGNTRSGNLLMDSFRSLQPPKLVQDILAEKGGVSEEPTAEAIIAIGPKGTTLGNIEVFEYLKRVPVGDVRGFGDFEDLFNALGLDKFEINEEQLDTLQKILDESNALRLGALRKLREDTALLLKSPPEVASKPFASNPEAEAKLLEVLTGQPEFMKLLEKLRGMTPAYAKVDLAQLAFLLRFYPDYVDAVIGGKPASVARERVRAVRDSFQQALRITYLEMEKEASAGQKPVKNMCPHVAAWVSIQKVKETADRMRLLAKYLAHFRGGEQENHYSCINCKQNLLCKHEYLLLQEFLHPRESQVLHKEILLNFSGGVFQGRYICSVCGQSISDIEYDNGLEYDDEGRPMIGRSVLVDEEAVEEEELNELLEAPAEVEEDLDFKVDTSGEGYKFRDTQLPGERQKDGSITPQSVAKSIYETAKQIYSRLGVEATKEAYLMIVEKSHSELLKLDDRATFMEKQAKAAKAKGVTTGAVDYDVFITRRLVGLVANFCLIDIQTHIPDYLIRSTLAGCRATFRGYPRGPREDLGALEYLACVVASIQRDKAPWNMTGWLRERQDKKRALAVQKYLEQLMELMMKDATIQQMFTEKDTYVRTVLGKAEDDSIKESLPQSFLPRPFKTGVEQAAEPVVEAVAGAAATTQAWITKAHLLAKKTAPVIEGSPYTEVTCCFSPVQTPGAFWTENGLPSPGSTIPRGSRGSRLVVHYEARKLHPIKLDAPEAAYPRVFLKVCFRGPRIGLPHEPGYTNLCPWCDFQFPADPATINPDMEGKEALLTQEVNVDQASFQQLLDRTHLNYSIPPFRTKLTVKQEAFYQQLRDFQPSPYTDWRDIIQGCFAEISKLEADATELQQVNAWRPLVEKLTKVHQPTLEARVGKGIVAELAQLSELSPLEVKSQLNTYFITPFERALAKKPVAELEGVLSDYELSSQHKEDIRAFLKAHYAFQKYFDGVFESPVIRGRAEELVARLSGIVNILSNIRVGLVRVGGERVVGYIIRAMIMGAFAEYADLNRVPPGVVSTVRDSTEATRKCLEVISRCIDQYKVEAKRYSDDEVRELITKRNEQEKLQFVREIADLSKELKQIEKIKKKLGLGKWAVGGTKAIYIYNEDRYDYERDERARAGIVDWPGYGPEGAPFPGGAAMGADGFPDAGGFYEAEGGYDVAQQGEDE